MEVKKWDDMTLQEQREKIKSNLAYEIRKSVKDGYAPFLKEQNSENIAHNGFSGNAYSGLNALLLDIKKAEMGYESDAWLTARGAIALGVNVGEKFSNLKDLPKVRIQFLQTDEVVPVYQKDANGNRIPVLDKNGEFKKSKNDIPLFKRALELDKDGKPIPVVKANGEIAKDSEGNVLHKFLTETKPLEKPQFISTELYNAQELVKLGLDMDKVKLPKKTLYKGKAFDNYKQGNEDFSKKAIVLDELGKDKMANYGLSDDIIAKIRAYTAKKNNIELKSPAKTITKAKVHQKTKSKSRGMGGMGM